MRIRYNAPVTLTFTLISTGVLLMHALTGGTLIYRFFSIGPSIDTASPVEYLRLITHVLGHADWNHLLSNFAFILLLGPILEEKHGSSGLFVMILITALVTGVLNVLLLPTGLLGASGIVFMMILLGSFTNFGKGDIPLTFILVVALYLAREFIAAFQADSISQFAHIIGGFCGGLFGFLRPRKT